MPTAAPPRYRPSQPWTTGRGLPPVATLVVAAALWGCATTGTKFAVRGFAPRTLLAVELVAASAVLWSVVLVRARARIRSDRRRLLPRRPRRPMQRREWVLATVLGLLEPALAYLADTVGLTHTSASNAAVISGMESTFVVLLAALFLRERLTRPLCLAILAALLGLLALDRVSWLTGPTSGDLLVLCGALSAAGYTIVARFLDETADPILFTARQFTVACAAALGIAVDAWVRGAEPLPTDVAARFWLVAFLVGTGGFGLSFVLYNRAIVRVVASTAAVVINLIPAFGLVSAVVCLGETPTPRRIGGAALITVSVAIYTTLERRRMPDPVSSGAI